MKKFFMSMVLVVLGLAASVNAAYYVAGDFNGWNSAGNLMTETSSGIWSVTLSEITAGRHEFKVTNGTWSVTYPGPNSWFIADSSGHITITFNANLVPDGWLPAQYRIGVSIVPETWTLVGNHNGWSNGDPNQAMIKVGTGIYEKTQTLAAGTRTFKTTYTGSWDAIGTDGRTINANNYLLELASATEVTVYVNALNGTMGIGGVVFLSPYIDKAHYPIPKKGAVVGTGTTVLSWTNPAPNNPADKITCDAYFLNAGTSKLTKDPNMGPTITDPGVVKIANHITVKTVTLPALVLPLQDNHYYYWAVHATDPNSGGPVTTKGDVWYFFTGDAAPVPSKPANQYMYLSQNDSALGDTNPNVRYFQVTASYTDDGKSPITDANLVNLDWGWDPDGADNILGNGDDRRGVTEVSDVHTPGVGGGTVTAIYKTEYNAADPNYSTTLPGYWRIRLEVTGSTGTAIGAAGDHQIFATCKEAAVADPDDPFKGYFDTNKDCKVNLADFADFAKAWLSQSVKYQ